MLEKIFKITEKNSTLKTEIFAGLTTFLSMSYILVVNPQVLGSVGINPDTVFIMTILASALTCILSAFLSNLPFAFSAGMGLNTYFAFTACGTFGFSWQVAAASVFVSGLIYLILVISGLRKYILVAIPKSLNTALTVGIGLFCAFIGLQMANIVMPDPSSYLKIFNWSKYNFNTYGISVLLGMIGIISIAFFHQKNYKGAILFGILLVWVLSGICQLCGLYTPCVEVSLSDGQSTAIWTMPVDYTPMDNERIVATWPSVLPKFDGDVFNIFIKNDTNAWSGFGACFAGFQEVVSTNSISFFIVSTLCFLIINFFDNVGCISGVSASFKLTDKDGNVPGLARGLISNAIGTCAAGFFGISPIAVFIESSSGISIGGKTGLTSLVVGILFLLSIIFAPLLLAVPKFVVAPALVFVGFLMMQSVVRIDFKNFINAFPAFLTIIIMPFTCSIADGIAWGLISYIILHLFAGKGISTKKEDAVHPAMIVIALCFLLMYTQM